MTTVYDKPLPLHYFVVHVVDQNGNQHHFDCEAEDAGHAKEQAENAYPEERVTNCVKMRQITD